MIDKIKSQGIARLLKNKLIQSTFTHKIGNLFICESKYNANYLAKLSFHIETLIDIGVAQGTPELYAAFPDKKMLLIDPQPVPKANLKEYQAKGYNMETIQICLGASKGIGKLNLQGRGSTLLKRTELTKRELSEEKEVKIDTLDHLISELDGFSSPFGLKIDTEGYEMEVLKGAKETLTKSSFVMLEVSIKKRFLDSYKFSDIVNFMANQGFELFDFLNYEPMRSPRYLDCLFVPYNSDFFQRVDI